MKRLVSVLSIVCLLLALTSCGEQPEPLHADVVLIRLRDSGRYWDALVEEKTRMLCKGKYSLEILDIDDTEMAVQDAFSKAFGSMGAAAVILTGYEGNTAEISAAYPEKRVLRVFSGAPTVLGENEGAVLLSDTACGFLAGYACVFSGGRDLGFIGAEGAGSVDMGFGLIQGADQAAKDLNVPEREAVIRYWYCPADGTAAENALVASSWQEHGMGLLFTNGAELPEQEGSVDRFCLEDARNCLERTAEKAVEAAVTGKDFDAYKDLSYASRNGDMPGGFAAFEGFSGEKYRSVFADLFTGARFGNLRGAKDTDGLGNPEAVFNGLVLRIEFFG